MIEYVTEPKAPAPAGHYSQATLSGGFLFISGQLPIDAGDAAAKAVPFAEQAHRALSNMMTILRSAGGSAKDLVKVTAYIVGVEHWADFNRVYGALLGDARPARSVVPVPALHLGFLVEIDAIARGIRQQAK